MNLSLRPDWLADYSRATFSSDLSAGITVAVMLIPQAMAYAMLAGLPPVVGLYASVVPLLVYAFVGTSRQLAVGPVAMVSLLTATGVGAIAASGTEAYLAAAILLALMVGAVQMAMGFLRLGYLVNFLSHPVLSGFTSAAALIIGSSQLKHVMGVSIPRSHHVHSTLIEAWHQLPAANVATVVLGVGSMVALFALKRVKKLPGPLLVVAGAMLAVVGLGLAERGVALVGAVPSGLPTPSMPTLDMEVLRELIPIGLTISLVAFMESISVAKVFADKHDYRLDPDRELIGLGASNLASALFGGYAVTGGFSRSAVNDQAGAKTPMAAVITALGVAAALLFLTPLFAYLPKAVLAAIILVAVVGLVDLREVKHLWSTDRVDLALLLTTFVATLSFGIEQGILVGVGASMVVFVARRTRPHFAVLGRLPGTRVWRNVENYEDAATVPGVLALRFDAAFYFGNVTFLEDTLQRLEAESQVPLTAVVLDAAAINALDSTAAHALSGIAAKYRARGIRLLLAGAKGPVREVLARTGLDEELGAENLTLTVCTAMEGLGFVCPEVPVEGEVAA
ncbi:MAG: solute carrier family 26 protein [Deltaproteobacteria bacterium]|nr:solute carrier family 26 protein [Deltaproteobacteria bacterium]